MAKLVDAPDLSSGVQKWACGFESHSGYTAAGSSKEVDNAMSTFKSTITKLVATKAEKQDEIKKLESECSALDGVSTKVNNLASKLEALFE